MKISTVWKVINEWDPINKLDGISIDEYKHEINRIASLHKNDVKSPEQLAKVIHDIFSRNYGEKEFKSSVDECLEVAAKLLAENR